MKKFAAILLSMALVVTMAGCSNAKGEGAETGSAKKVGIIMPALDTEFIADTANQIKTQLEENGMKTAVMSSDNSPTKQLEQLENCVNMNMDSILIFPLASNANEIGTKLSEIKNNGIQVHVMGNSVDLGCFNSEILIDQKAVGEGAAQMAADWIDQTFPDAADGTIEVAIISNNSSTEMKEKSDALQEVITMTKKAKIVENYEMAFGDPVTKAQEKVEMLLNSHPNVKVILACSAQPALAIDETIMRNNGITKDQFGIFSSDYMQEIGKRIESSVENKSVIRGTSIYGDGTVTPIIDAINETLKLNEENIYYYETYKITPENVGDYLSK